MRGRSGVAAARRPNCTLIIFLAGSVTILLLRLLFPERPMDYTGPRALLDQAFALWLLGVVLVLAVSLGRRGMRWLGLGGLASSERNLFALGIGLAGLAYGILALGLVGLWRPSAIVGWLLLVAIATWREAVGILNALPSRISSAFHRFVGLGVGEKVVVVVGLLMLAMSLVQALAPPWGYDGLMYHLQGPRLFLEAGRIMLLPDLWQANGPFTIEMLFAIGLATGTDVFARLVHLSFGAGVVVATFLFGRRYIGRLPAWRATAILLGVPALPLWASLAYIDVAWAFYEFLAFYALAIWVQKRRYSWLATAGFLAGVALGSKYLALKGVFVLSLWLLWQSRRRGWGALVRSMAVFGGVAALVAGPWYVKNWLWGGNPVYPFVWGGRGWDQTRLALLMGYMNGFGSGRDLIALALSPWNLIARHEQFSTIFKGVEFPSLLFPLALVYPFTKKTPILNGLAFVSLVGYVLWFWGTQQIRFLLPIYPALSLLSAYVLGQFIRAIRTTALNTVLLAGLPGSMLLVALIVQTVVLLKLAPIDPVLGRESKAAFLTRIVGDFPALTYIRQNLPPEARVLMLWDGQGYYCDRRCLPDADQSRWTYLVASQPDLEALTAQLRQEGVTHLLVSGEYHLIVDQDSSGIHRAALARFEGELISGYTTEVYRDGWVKLYALRGSVAAGVESHYDHLLP